MVRSEHWLVSGAAPSYDNGLEFIKFILLFFSSLQFFVASVSPAFSTVTFRVFLAHNEPHRLSNQKNLVYLAEIGD